MKEKEKVERQMTSFAIDVDTLARLRELRERTGVSFVYLVNLLLKKSLETYEKERLK